MDYSSTKSQLRAEAKLRLQSVRRQGEEWRSRADLSIASKSFDWLSERLTGPKGLVGLFRAMDEEPDLFSVFKNNFKYLWAFPRVNGENLRFYRWQEGLPWERGSFGIEEPSETLWQGVKTSELAALCVPALAFDQKGRRLGRGKGFYDRTLAQFNGLKIGVAYEVQVFSGDLPVEAHDVSMDVVVTEAKLREVKSDGK